MRILSCHIENFGKLSDVTFDFTEGLNVFLQENGWGKSTLAAFIRSMFYGLEGDGKRDDISCERKRFAPWQGGAFGGSLKFDNDGKEYVVSRVFGVKAADDVFELRDLSTNLISNDYSKMLGEELFGINSESFMRTVFIRQSDCSFAASTDDINAKLGNISDGIDLNRFAAAETWFKDYFNSMSATRKTGAIARLKAQATDIKASLRGMDSIPNTISEIEQRIKDEKERVSLIKDKITSVDAQKEKAAILERKLGLKRQYKLLKDEYELRYSQLNKRREFFPKDVPGRAEVKEWEASSKKLLESGGAIPATELSDYEKEIYSSLLTTFSQGVPSENSVDELIYDASSMESAIKNSYKYAFSSEEEEKYEEYQEKFGGVYDPTSLIKGRKSKKALLFYVAALLFILVAVALYFVFDHDWIPSVLLISGSLCLVGAAINARAKAEKEKETQLLDAYEYKSLCEKKKRYDEYMGNSDFREKERKIKGFLSSYSYYAENESYVAALTELKGKVRHFNTLDAKVKDYSKAKGTVSSIEEKLKQRFIELGLWDNTDIYKRAEEILDAFEEYDSLMDSCKEAKDKLDAFTASYDLSDVSGEDVCDAESIEALTQKSKELNELLDEERSKMALDMRTLDSYNIKYEEYNELNAELDRVLSEIDEKTTEVKYSEKAWDYLSKAKENLTARYMEPLMSGFSKYYKIITDEQSDAFCIDANTVITKEEKGRQRSTALLSDGYRDLIGFSMRIAMADAMYKDNKPMLILDDPFVNLDDSKMEGARKLIKEISKDYQTLYLTCRENRL